MLGSNTTISCTSHLQRRATTISSDRPHHHLRARVRGTGRRTEAPLSFERVPSTRRMPQICICAALHLRTTRCSFAFPSPTASAARAIHGSAFLSSPLHELPGSLFIRRQELRCRCSGEDADAVECEGYNADADAVGTDSTQGRGSAGAFREERAVITGEKATGKVVVVATLCRQAITSRRHAVTWRRHLLASFVASVAQCPFLRYWIRRAAHPDSYRATVFRKTPNRILLIF
jgi:hypothetical protein